MDELKRLKDNQATLFPTTEGTNLGDFKIDDGASQSLMLADFRQGPD